jgi:hypothetical protein
MSDGVKAYTGLVCAAASSDYRIYLIDEPEAFLHPPLARLLGRHLTKLVSENCGKALVATHSPEFLMGCVETGASVAILRLTFDGLTATARQLPEAELRPLLRDPLLRSSNVLSALFADGAIVSESDTDRALYQECAVRLEAQEPRLFRSTVFLQGQNKQTVRRIIEPLRRMGVAAAAIIDLDIIKKGDELKALIDACGVPEQLARGWGQTRGEIYALYTQKSIDPKCTGLAALTGPQLEAATSFLDSLADYGIFVVPVGELERWLVRLGVSGHGPGWLVEVFERLGNDASSGQYVRPTNDDVWEFLRRIAKWLGNPNRKGMP